VIKFDYTLVSLEYFWDGWHPLPAAKVDYHADYTPDASLTLIIGSEALHISLSGPGDQTLLPPLRVVRLSYGGFLVGSGLFTVDTVTTVQLAGDAAAEARGEAYRTECTCSAVGAYAAMLDVEVSYATERPAGETAYEFITQFVAVGNWGGVA
jgi:hypothetical protein